jgi:DNA-directed RNA polymerase subunit RPC12/RpoP
MTIRFICPSCGRPLVSKDEKAGKSSKCPKCGSAITVPSKGPPDQATDSSASQPDFRKQEWPFRKTTASFGRCLRPLSDGMGGPLLLVWHPTGRVLRVPGRSGLAKIVLFSRRDQRRLREGPAKLILALPRGDLLQF